MFVQITTKDSLGTIVTATNVSNDSMYYILIGIIVFGLLLYFIFKPTKIVFSKNSAAAADSSKSKAEHIPIVTQEIKNDADITVTDDRIKPKSIIVHDTSALEPKEAKVVVKQEIEIPTKSVEVVIPDDEEQTKEKYIGYHPINLFAQTEPLSFPYVIMPQPNCVIKFPRKGRTGRKGFKEEAFKTFIEQYFRYSHQILDDRFVLIKNSSKPYEPDFALVNEKNGINIFLDIEIDEPYEGTNEIATRKPTHYQYSDTNRNNSFKNRGWIVIRFAEIQVHQQPDSCCKLIADVLKSIDGTYTIPERLSSLKNISIIPQWTIEEAKQWSLEKYRERYLGIERFGITTIDNLLVGIEETAFGEAIEERVIENDIQNDIPHKKKVDNYAKVYTAIFTNSYLSLSINGEKTIVKPINTTEKELIAFCYVKNRERTFAIINLEDLEVKVEYHTLRVAGPTIGLEKISNIVNTAIQYQKHIRMKYTRASWQQMLVDTETGELILDRIEAEESIRTISDVQLAINALSEEHIEAYRLNGNYLTAYCNKREEQRTFRFDRIGEIEILDI
jgi:hypothetical protein